MAMTKDGQVYRYGMPENNQLVAYGVAANQQLYYGEVALVASGSGSITEGYLKNAGTYGSGDTVVGMIGEPAGGTLVRTASGLLGGTSDGMVQVDVLTGAFYFQSGSGSDQLSATTNGKTVYYGGENSTGPIACATSSSNTRPILGIQLPQDPGIANGFSPGSSYWPVKLNVVGGP